MKTIVQGKKIKETYKVVTERDDNNKLVEKPKIILADTEIKWEDILSYDERPQSKYTSNIFNLHLEIYLNENELVRVIEEIFRADLGIWYQRVNKELEKKDNLKKCEKELKPLLEEYNVQMIESNDAAKAYCDLHKLNYAHTDYEELLKLLPNNSISIKIDNELCCNSTWEISPTWRLEPNMSITY